CVGRYPGYQVLNYGFRVPLGGAINFIESELPYALIIQPEVFPAELKQDSGTASLLQMFGISEAERNFATANGNAALTDLLRQHRSYPVTPPARKSIVR